MSLRVLTIVWDRFPEGGSKLLAMLALADWAGDDGGRIYPSVATLAAKIRMSERHTKRLLDELIGDNWIELISKENKGGRKRSNRYRVNLKTLTSCHSLVRETLTFEPETLTPVSGNSDIAMSDEPLEPLYKPLPADSVELKSKIFNQKRFLETLKKSGAAEGEVAEHQAHLHELEAKLEAIFKQDDLFAGVPENEIENYS